jgi:hypothetical protein
MAQTEKYADWSPTMRKLLKAQDEAWERLIREGGTTAIVYREIELDLRRDTPCRRSVTNIHRATLGGEFGEGGTARAAALNLYTRLGLMTDPLS